MFLGGRSTPSLLEMLWYLDMSWNYCMFIRLLLTPVGFFSCSFIFATVLSYFFSFDCYFISSNCFFRLAFSSVSGNFFVACINCFSSIVVCWRGPTLFSSLISSKVFPPTIEHSSSFAAFKSKVFYTSACISRCIGCA